VCTEVEVAAVTGLLFLFQALDGPTAATSLFPTR